MKTLFLLLLCEKGEESEKKKKKKKVLKWVAYSQYKQREWLTEISTARNVPFRGLKEQLLWMKTVVIWTGHDPVTPHAWESNQ